MEHGFVGDGEFLPAHQDAAVTVQPGVRALDYPAPWLAGMRGCGGPILATAADVGDEAVIVGELPGAIVIVALIQAQVLGLRRRRVGAGRHRGVQRLLQ